MEEHGFSQYVVFFSSKTPAGDNVLCKEMDHNAGIDSVSDRRFVNTENPDFI